MRTAGISIKKINTDGCRFEGKYFLNDNSYLSMLIEDQKDTTALSEMAEVFNPPVFKRQFCSKTKRAVPYYQSSDVQNSSEVSDVYVFGGQASKLNLLVHSGDILVTGFGTIGNIRLVNRHQDGVCYANNVCRVRIKNGEKRGYIYAFLSSKYGKAQLNKNASGSVVRYIESPGIKKTLIPRFTPFFMDKIDGMIQEASQLREEAKEALKTVHNRFAEEISIKIKPISHSVNIREIISLKGKRLEGVIYTEKAKAILDIIVEAFDYKTAQELTANIFTQNIFKREYVENGHPFLMGADILKAIPTASKYISYRQASKKDELFVKEGWILMTCSGSVGDVVFVDKQLEPFIYTHDLIRIVPKDYKTQLYLFGFLSSPIGKELVNHFKYGSVIQHLESFHVADIPVPMLGEYFDEIVEKVRKYTESVYKAKILELEAISLVEAEIEKWSK